MTIYYDPIKNHVELQTPPTRMEGRYSFKKSCALTGRVIEEIEGVDNLITDNGLQLVKTNWTAAMFVGTGTTPPTATDTTLQTYRAYTVTTNVSWNRRSAVGNAPDYWVEGAGTWRFAAGVATGNLTEVGFGSLISAGTPPTYSLFSRALIVDSGGNPITITVLPSEILDVTYTLRIYAPVASVVNTVNISGTNYTFTTQRYSYSEDGTDPTGSTGIALSSLVVHAGASLAFSGDINSTTPFTGSTFNTTISDSQGSISTTYPAGQQSAVATLNAGLTGANVGGMRGLVYQIRNAGGSLTGIHQASYRVIISPAIPKNNTNVLTFGISWSWARRP